MISSLQSGSSSSQHVLTWQVFITSFTLPATGFDFHVIIVQPVFRLMDLRPWQLPSRGCLRCAIRSIVRFSLVLPLQWHLRHCVGSSQGPLDKANLMLRREAPGALVAVHIETALSRNPDQLWVRAGGRGRWQLVVTQRSTADCTVDAAALVFTASSEGLAILVNPAIVLTCASI